MSESIDAASTAHAPGRAPRAWLALGVGSLLLAGVLALGLVAGRVPPLSGLFTSPAIFRRFLVVHVDLSLVAWLSAFVACLGALASAPGGRARWSRAGAGLAAAGVVLLAACAALPSGEPVLSNYVPAIDAPLFVAALAVFGAGLAVGCAAPLTAGPGSALPGSAAAFARGALVVALAALATFAASFATTPAGLGATVTWELRAWGGGHVLQLASLSAMLAAWLALTARSTGREALGARSSRALAAVLAAPTLAAPLVALAGTASPAGRSAFTHLMRWGTWPVALVVLAACVAAHARARREGAIVRPWSDPRAWALAASAALCLTGFVLGALIRGSSTLVPGHYHASIGAVTCAFMAIALDRAPQLGLRPVRSARAAAVQPPLFAAGQLVFAVGFAVAGAAGMGRKVYGAEQAVRSSTQHAGLVVMGLGGLVAVAGGLLFLSLVVPAFRRGTPSRAPLPVRFPRRTAEPCSAAR